MSREAPAPQPQRSIAAQAAAFTAGWVASPRELLEERRRTRRPSSTTSASEALASGRRRRRRPASSSAASSASRARTRRSCRARPRLSTWSAPMVDKARRSAFVCQQCGHAAPRWLGQCPGCGAWSTMVEEALPEPRARGARAGAPGGEKPRPLAAVTAGAALRRTTGLAELDRVLGGGLVAGSVVLVGGDPGIGKSTLALQACGALARQGLPVLYVAGEESPEPVRLRADRLGMAEAGVLVVAVAGAERVGGLIGETRPAAVVVDSIQTLRTGALGSAPGSVGQVRESAG